jgi:hypothetical protein
MLMLGCGADIPGTFVVAGDGAWPELAGRVDGGTIVIAQRAR